MSDILSQLENLSFLVQANLFLTFELVGALWIIHIINFLLGYRLCVLGIHPRHPLGLIGIPFFSFLHGDFNHLFFNSIPLLVLINFTLLEGINEFVCVTQVIILIGGGLLWLFGRKAIHVGASCLIMGYLSHLLIEAYQAPSIAAVAPAVICLYYFGGLLLSIFPQEEKISWEGHLFGLIAGILPHYLCILH